MMVDFKGDEKCETFDKIAAKFFKQNFGSMTKADFETLLFSEYLEYCMNNGIPFDDYSLSKELGITQNRIRSLKERKALQYPREGFDWKSDFLKALSFAKYDQSDHKVKFIIQDINVMNEARHYNSM